jgi:hypothetical protein
MTNPPDEFLEMDWTETPATVKTLILAQQQEIHALRQKNEKLRGQHTDLATEQASLRKRIGRSSCDFSKPSLSEGKGSSRMSRARAVAASAAFSQVTPDPGLSC